MIIHQYYNIYYCIINNTQQQQGEKSQQIFFLKKINSFLFRYDINIRDIYHYELVVALCLL